MGADFFELHRDEDATGVSGTGLVAQGVVFRNGKVALAWHTEPTSVAVYDGVDDVIAIHGHEGKTRLMWGDQIPAGLIHEEAPGGPIARAEPWTVWPTVPMIVMWFLLGAGAALLLSSFW